VSTTSASFFSVSRLQRVRVANTRCACCCVHRAHGSGERAALPPLHVELQRRIKRSSGTAVLVPEYHDQRPLGVVSKVTLRSLERKWAIQRKADAAAREEVERNKDAVAAEKVRIKQQKEEIRRVAVGQREVRGSQCNRRFLFVCTLARSAHVMVSRACRRSIHRCLRAFLNRRKRWSALNLRSAS
jgi:hypothetical protein